MRDTVTSLTANSRPHHAIGADGVPVLGHAHSGFLTTARWQGDGRIHSPHPSPPHNRSKPPSFTLLASFHTANVCTVA